MVQAIAETDEPHCDHLMEGQAKTPTFLKCSIVNSYILPGGSRCCDYIVCDGQKVVARGTSSSPEWVKHDAGGYHTKRDFDQRYPDGWSVSFDFE